jgi:hypothetical protein
VCVAASAAGDAAASQTRPFVKLRPATALFFERALEEARKRVDSSSGVYPYDLLSHDERIVVLARVAVSMAGYGPCEATAVTESALFNVFAAARDKVEAEAEAGAAAAAAEAAAAAASAAERDAAGAAATPGAAPPPLPAARAAAVTVDALTGAMSVLTPSGAAPIGPGASAGAIADLARGETWRLLLLGAFTEEWGAERVGVAELLGPGAVPVRREVWGTLVDMVAERAVFGRDAYGIKKALFLERDPIQQRLLHSQLLAGTSSSNGNGASGSSGSSDAPLRWFPPRPPPATDAELGEAERQVAALTPKGRELMQGLFPSDHFAAKMTMRQLVFSVEGSYSSYCSCDSCMRCRSAVERLHRQSHGVGGGKGRIADGHGGGGGHHKDKDGHGAHAKGGSSGDKSGDKSGAAGASSAATAAAIIAAGGPAAVAAAAAAASAAASGGLPEEGALPAAAWAAVGGAQRDVAKFFTGLAREARRDALRLPAVDLDRSMAASRDWDILVTAELDYDYGGGKGALVEYDSARDAFLPGPALLDGAKGAAALLSSLDPATVAEVGAWRDPRAKPSGSTKALEACLLEESPARTMQLYGRRLLELHFTRLFAVRLLGKFAEAAREAAARDALEALLREEETEAQRNATKAARKKEKERSRLREKEAAALAAREAAAAAAEEAEAAEAARKEEDARRAEAARRARAEAEAAAEAEYEAARKAAAGAAAAAAAAAAANGGDDGDDAAEGTGSRSRRRRGKKGAAAAAGAAPATPAQPEAARGGGSAPAMPLPSGAKAKAAKGQTKAQAAAPPPPVAEWSDGAAAARSEVEQEAEELARAIRESLADEAARKARAEIAPIASAPAMRAPTARPPQQLQQQLPQPLPPMPLPPMQMAPQMQMPQQAQQAQHMAHPMVAMKAAQPPLADASGWLSQQQQQAPAPLQSRGLFGAAAPPAPPPQASYGGGLSGWAPAAAAAGLMQQPPLSAPAPPPAQLHAFSSPFSAASWSGASTWAPSAPADAWAAATAAAASAGRTPADELARLHLGSGDGGGGGWRGHGGLGGGGAAEAAFAAFASGPQFAPPPRAAPPPADDAAAAARDEAAAAAGRAFVPQQAGPPGGAPGSGSALSLGAPRAGLEPPLPFVDGAMFVCTKFTQEECMRRRLLGLPRRDLELVTGCTPYATALFLFNFSSRELHGLFVASSPGRLNWDGDAWKRSLYHRPSARASSSSPFPSQVKFRVVKEYSPLHEDAFGHLIRGSNRVTPLDLAQVKELIRLFAKHDTLGAPANPGAFVPDPAERDAPPQQQQQAGGALGEPRGERSERGTRGGAGRAGRHGPGANTGAAAGLVPLGGYADRAERERAEAANGYARGGGGFDPRTHPGGPGGPRGLGGLPHMQHALGGGMLNGHRGAPHAPQHGVPQQHHHALGGGFDDDTDADAHAAAAAAASVEMLFRFDDALGSDDGGGQLGSGGLGSLGLGGRLRSSGGDSGVGLDYNDDDGLCIVCMEQPQDSVLQPCGHARYCYTCVADLAACPLCRERVLRISPL